MQSRLPNPTPPGVGSKQLSYSEVRRKVSSSHSPDANLLYISKFKRSFDRLRACEDTVSRAGMLSAKSQYMNLINRLIETSCGHTEGLTLSGERTDAVSFHKQTHRYAPWRAGQWSWARELAKRGVVKGGGGDPLITQKHRRCTFAQMNSVNSLL